MSQELAEYLEVELNARGLSQRKLAEKSGISLSTFQRAYNDDKDKPISWDGCAGIAHGLRVNPISVFVKAGLLPREPSQSSDERHLLHVFRQLPTEHQRTLMDFCNFLFTNRNRTFWIDEE